MKGEWIGNTCAVAMQGQPDDRGPQGFELWHSGERMSDPAHKKHLNQSGTDHGFPCRRRWGCEK